jgi:transcriptional regulator with XRE-family HTH domain
VTSHIDPARPLDDADEFESYLQDALKDPAYRAGYEDAMRLHKLLDELVVRRKDLGLTQKQVADRMGVRQPTISGFETEASDPKVTTIQRYARAVDACVHFMMEATEGAHYFSRGGSSYVATEGVKRAPGHSASTSAPAQWADFRLRNDYVLAA